MLHAATVIVWLGPVLRRCAVSHPPPAVTTLGPVVCSRRLCMYLNIRRLLILRYVAAVLVLIAVTPSRHRRFQRKATILIGCHISYFHDSIYIYIYRVSQEECAKLRESVPYVKLYRYNPKHLYPKLNGYGDNGRRSLKL